jgi:hypothetical protein
MDENSDLKNGVRVKMKKLNLVVIQESIEEIADRETEPMLEEGGEHHNFICVGCWNVLAGGRAPLQHRVVWEKMARNKLAYLIFIRNGWLEQVRIQGGHGQGKDCAEHEDGASVEAERVERLKEKWRRRKE